MLRFARGKTVWSNSHYWLVLRCPRNSWTNRRKCHMIMNFINVMIARSTFIAEGEKKMTCCLLLFFCKTGEDGKNFMKQAVVLQGTCCRNYVPDSFNSVGIWKNKVALMCSLCENQLKSIDILESKLENLKEEVGRKISNILKEDDERSKPESPKESSPKWVCQRNILTSSMFSK